MARGISRRSVLRGLVGGAAVSIGLPTLDLWLDSNGSAFADGSALPRRFGVFYWGNGVIPSRWVPTGEGVGDAWALSEQLAPFAPVKDKLTVVTGTRVMTGNSLAHAAGASGILTGAPITVTNSDTWTVRAPSVDQLLAQAIGGETRFRSLEVAAEQNARGESRPGPEQLNPPEWSPMRLYQRLFGDGFVAPGETPIIDPKLALRRSVLDAVMEDSRRLQTRVGARDRERLDKHFAAIRDLETRLARLQDDPPSLAACERPDPPADAYPRVDARQPFTEINAVMCDMIAMALACDQTRVFSYWFSDSVSNALYAGRSAGHHRLTHDEPGDQPEVNEIVKFIMQQASVLLQRLDAVVEGDGTLLDNAAVLLTTDSSLARQHALEEFPIAIAGSACGRLRTGLHYRSPSGNESSSKVLLSLIRAMGVPQASFGLEGGLVTDGLGAIEI
jgi:hypothetical protein